MSAQKNNIVPKCVLKYKKSLLFWLRSYFDWVLNTFATLAHVSYKLSVFRFKYFDHIPLTCAKTNSNLFIFAVCSGTHKWTDGTDQVLYSPNVITYLKNNYFEGAKQFRKVLPWCDYVLTSIYNFKRWLFRRES